MYQFRIHLLFVPTYTLSFTGSWRVLISLCSNDYFITGLYLTFPVTTPIPLRYHSELLPNHDRRNSEGRPKKRSTLTCAHARVPYNIYESVSTDETSWLIFYNMLWFCLKIINLNLYSKMPLLIISDLQGKLCFITKNMLKYFVDWEKSSTFAPDFALNASERLNDANDTEKRNAENQPLTKKVKK